MENTAAESIYEQLGISREVYEFGQKTEQSLEQRFREFDRTAEYNQLKVLHAMQENRVSEACFNYASGYGYNDQGRDTLEAVYASPSIRKQPLCVPRLPAALMLWPSPLQQIYAPETSFSHRWESPTTHWRK